MISVLLTGISPHSVFGACTATATTDLEHDVVLSRERARDGRGLILRRRRKRPGEIDRGPHADLAAHARHAVTAREKPVEAGTSLRHELTAEPGEHCIARLALDVAGVDLGDAPRDLVASLCGEGFVAERLEHTRRLHDPTRAAGLLWPSHSRRRRLGNLVGAAGIEPATSSV